MAPQKFVGSAGLRVLLAGHTAADLQAAQTLLQNEGALVTLSLNSNESAKLLQADRFDVAVVEVQASSGTGATDGLDFLDVTNIPTVVALDSRDAGTMVKAVELGAVDILQTPVAAQTGRLATLWQHTLRKLHKKSAADSDRSASTNATSGAGSTAAEAQECSEGDVLVKAILPDLFETALWEQHDLAGTSAMDGSSVDTPDTPDICHRLSQDLTDSQGLSSCYNPDFGPSHSGSSIAHDPMMKCHSISSALSPMLVPQGESQCEMFSLQPTFSECLSFVDGDSCEDARHSKKQKVEWTRDLHDRFVVAVEGLSVDKAVPSKILERMGPCSEGLTRQNIASHLQKYRNRKRSRHSMGFVAPFKSPSTSNLPPLLPAPASWSSPSPAWSPIPASGQYQAPCSWSAAPMQAQTNQNICFMISEVLSQPQSAAPLGLKLDTDAVLAQMSNTRLIQA